MDPHYLHFFLILWSLWGFKSYGCGGKPSILLDPSSRACSHLSFLSAGFSTFLLLLVLSPGSSFPHSSTWHFFLPCGSLPNKSGKWTWKHQGTTSSGVKSERRSHRRVQAAASARNCRLNRMLGRAGSLCQELGTVQRASPGTPLPLGLHKHLQDVKNGSTFKSDKSPNPSMYLLVLPS